MPDINKENVEDGTSEPIGVDFVKMSELFSALAKFEDDPIEANASDYHKILERLTVKAYCPIGEKAAAIVKIVGAITADNLLDYVIDLPLAEFAYGLLPYATNLVDDISGKPVLGEDGKPRESGGKPLLVTLMDPAIFDLADRIGLPDYLRSFCDPDYKELLRLTDAALNFRDIERVERFAEQVSSEKLEALPKAVREFKGLLTSGELKDLASIASAADPAWAATKSIVADQAVQAAMNAAVTGSRPESERKAGAEAVAQYKAEQEAQPAKTPKKA